MSRLRRVASRWRPPAPSPPAAFRSAVVPPPQLPLVNGGGANCRGGVWGARVASGCQRCGAGGLARLVLRCSSSFFLFLILSAVNFVVPTFAAFFAAFFAFCFVRVMG